MLSAQGLPQGTVGFDNFVRDLQTVIDPVDPINYAAAAAANHPLHVIEVLGDTAVPNAPNDYIAQLWGLPSRSTTAAVAPPATVSGIVRFRSGRALVAVQPDTGAGRDHRDAAPNGHVRRQRRQRHPDHRYERREYGETDAKISAFLCPCSARSPRP